MAIKFRRVKRPRRKPRRNPAKKSLFFWGVMGIGVFLLLKKMKAETDARKALAAASQKQLTAQVAPAPSAADPATVEAIHGLGGGIFGGTRGYGSL